MPSLLITHLNCWSKSSRGSRGIQGGSIGDAVAGKMRVLHRVWSNLHKVLVHPLMGNIWRTVGFVMLGVS